jgi:hypothetical protein
MAQCKIHTTQPVWPVLGVHVYVGPSLPKASSAPLAACEEYRHFTNHTNTMMLWVTKSGQQTAGPAIEVHASVCRQCVQCHVW